MTDTALFFLSSLQPMPSSFFVGFGFFGPDLVIGAEGYRDYRDAKGVRARPGNDGAYVTVETVGNLTTVGTDFCGYFKLYFYRHGDIWAISNSIMSLIYFAKEMCLPVTPNKSHLSALTIRGAFTNQLASLKTPVKEITLVPASEQICITRMPQLSDRIEFRRTDLVISLDRGGTYRDALAGGVNTWVSRMSTILSSGIHISSDLTGGRDSRAVLALLLSGNAELTAKNVYFRCGISASDDLAVAGAISSHYGLRLNESKPELGSAHLSRSVSYERWRNLCPGVYAPIYFPAQDRGLNNLIFGGAGGESHRRFYKAGTLEELILSRRKHFKNDQEFEEFRSDVVEDTNRISVGYESDLDPLILHYRHFRERGHGGRGPQWSNLCNPLGSSFFRKASALCAQDHLERSQFLIDIMENCAPGLASMGYDRADKLPDHRHISEVTKVTILGETLLEGRVFSAECGDVGRLYRESVTQWDYLLWDVEEGAEAAAEVLGAAYVKSAITSARSASFAGKLGHAVDGVPMSNVVIAAAIMGHKDVCRPSSEEVLARRREIMAYRSVGKLSRLNKFFRQVFRY